MKNFSFQNKFAHWVWARINHYDHNKYWKRRSIITDPNDKTFFLLKLYYLYYIKKTDSRHNSSFGTTIGSGAQFATPPVLLHGPNGIIVGHNVKVGKNCTIMQQVTIEESEDGIIIGDNVFIGAGAKILKNVHIGDNCLIGANAVVVEDMPSYSTCVLSKPRIIKRDVHN